MESPFTKMWQYVEELGETVRLFKDESKRLEGLSQQRQSVISDMEKMFNMLQEIKTKELDSTPTIVSPEVPE